MGTGGGNPKEAWVKISTQFANVMNEALRQYLNKTKYLFSAGVNGKETYPWLKQFDKGEFVVEINGQKFIVTIKPKDLK